MKHTTTKRYAVKTSVATYATIISQHHTLPEAYRAMVRAHRALYKNHRFTMAQTVIAIIATEESNLSVEEAIHSWATLDRGPPSRQRLPLPIVVHQWNPRHQTYLRFGATRND